MYSNTAAPSSRRVFQVWRRTSSCFSVEKKLSASALIEAVAAGSHRDGDAGVAGLLTEGQ